MTAAISHFSVLANVDGSWFPCGHLSLVENGSDSVSSSFEYARAYLQRSNAFSVDPVSLPVKSWRPSASPLIPVNGLPFFGAVRDATPDAWGRRVIEAKLGAPLNGLKESQYLLPAGSNRVGALDIRAKASAAPMTAPDSWETLSDIVEAADRIDRGIALPAHLTGIFVQGACLGGARPKASVRDERGTLQLAKLSSASDRFDVPGIEYATLRLAEKAGLRVPAVRLVRVNDRSVLLIRRFDRYWRVPGDKTPKGDSRFVRGDAAAGAMEQRVPFVSALTLMACDEWESRYMSYANLVACMQRHCRAPFAYDGAAELFKRMVFNILVSNSDDHLRNFGFLWDADVASWRLSPAYDLTPQPSIATERFQHLSVGKSGRLATLDNALTDHDAFPLSKKFACELIADVWEVVSQWRDAFDGFGIDPQEIQKVASAFRHIDDIASRELRHQLP